MNFDTTILDRNLAQKTSALEVTQLYRNLSLESLEELAIERFKGIMPEASNDEINSLLKGDLVIDGELSNGVISNPTLVEATDDFSKRFKQNVNFIFRGLFKHSDGEFYRPYGYVKSYGVFDLLISCRQMPLVMRVLEKNWHEYDEDMHKDMLRNQVASTAKRGTDLVAKLKRNPTYRAKHYAKDDADIAVYIDGGHEIDGAPEYLAILCEKVKDVPPSFFDGVHKDVTSAVNHLIQVAGLDSVQEYGHSVSYSNLFGNGLHLQSEFVEEIIEDNNYWSKYASARDYFYNQLESKFLANTKKKIDKEAKRELYPDVDLKDEDGKVLASVPYLPLLCWALKRSGMRDSMPDYNPQSPMGMKMQNDCRFHTDWMIGAGLDLDDDYSMDSEVQKAAARWSHNFQYKEFGFKHHLLSKGSIVTGRVKHCNVNNAHEVNDGDIVVIPNGSADYQLHVEAATRSGKGGVIAVISNRVAHLTKVSREMGVTMFQLEDALKTLPEGLKVTLDPVKGEIIIPSKD